MHRRNFIKSSALGAGVIGTGSLPAMSLSQGHAAPKPVAAAPYCLLPAHDIPVIADVDILIVGGTDRKSTRLNSSH